MLSRLPYQDLRGLTRSFSLDLPVSMSQVHCTSLAVNGLPSCHDTPSRSGSVNSVPSSLHDQPVARSGTIDRRLFCGTRWSYMTRLLNTPIIGPSAKTVASSRIDMLAGLSGLYIFRMPPCFCAKAVPPPDTAISNALAAATARNLSVIPLPLLVHRLRRGPCRVLLFVKPDVFPAVAVKDAVDHDGHSFDVGLPAGPAAGVEDDRPDALLDQLALDCPDQLLAPSRVAFDRLLLDQLVDLRVAIAVPVHARTASIERVEDRVGVGPLPWRLRATVKSLRRILANQLVVSMVSSSPSKWASFNWSIRITAASR